MLNPKDFDVPANYQHWEGDKAEDRIGPFFFARQNGRIETAFRAEDRHCNAHNAVHGGVLMTFADYTLCLGANGGEQQFVATVSCNNEFLAPANKGDLLLGEAEVLKRGRSLVFVRCVIRAGDVAILTASAVIKLLS
jgi:uncharacterized protein (TIGR00369 family)